MCEEMRMIELCCSGRTDAVLSCVCTAGFVLLLITVAGYVFGSRITRPFCGGLKFPKLFHDEQSDAADNRLLVYRRAGFPKFKMF